MFQSKCLSCNADLSGSSPSRKYCNHLCKNRYLKRHGTKREDGHPCRVCGTLIALIPGQNNKWICSANCRRARTAEIVRTFHERRPRAEAFYRARTKLKQDPDSNLKRFRRSNPLAPQACEACGEIRVLDIAHKPRARRFGEWRSARNCKWPSMVWVLCPTCHALLDRMNYSPEELGLAP